MKLRCYVCGGPVKTALVLATMSPTEVDRVFVVHPDCAEQINDESYLLAVKATS